MVGFEAATDALLRVGANSDAVNQDKHTPLHIAAHEGKASICSQLIEVCVLGAVFTMSTNDQQRGFNGCVCWLHVHRPERA